MRLVSLQHCREGMTLGKPVYHENGHILLARGAALSERLIRRLHEHGVTYVYIEDPRTEDVILPEPITQDTRQRAIAAMRDEFHRYQQQRSRYAAPTLAKSIGKVLDDIMTELARNEDALLMMGDIYTTDRYLLSHSLNVCLYALTLGIACGYTRDALYTLGLGAMLHDIGKTKIPLELLHKPDSLSDAEFDWVKKHAEYGYAMLKEEANIPLLAAHCAYQHHERIDGSGYPRALRGEAIHEYAQWVGLVDAFDAMTSNRVYRKAMLPHMAMETLFIEAGTKFAADKVTLFRQKIALYPLGLSVRLSSGESGIVVDVNSQAPHRPVIRVLRDADGAEPAAPYEIDLSKKLSVLVAATDVPL